MLRRLLLVLLLRGARSSSIQDAAICGFVAGVSNIQSIGFAGWKCTNGTAINLCVDMWTGLACSVQGQVLSIDLSSYGLTGTISGSLGNLTSMKVLKLNNNTLAGSIPSGLSLATNLNTLELQSNSFTGSIPSSFCSLTKLSTFEICSVNGNNTGCPNLIGCAPTCLYSSVVISDYGLISECSVPPTTAPSLSPGVPPSSSPTSGRPTVVPSFAPTAVPSSSKLLFEPKFSFHSNLPRLAEH